MKSAVIAGLGLIGGAVGMALRRRGWHVSYFDPHITLDSAQRAGAADARAESLADAQLVVLATPIDVAAGLLRTVGNVPVVTSVCSVMAPLRAIAGERFVAGHPMAGWHEGGLNNAHHVSLAGVRWFVDADDPRVEELIRDCGAAPVRVDATQHDAAVALTSHLPQVLATALFAYLSGQPDVAEFAGAGLRSFRLAAGESSMWGPVLDANRENLRPHAAAIADLVRAIVEGEDDEAFDRARALWRKLSG